MDKTIKQKFGVDSGALGIFDYGLVAENKGHYGDTAKRLCVLIDVEPGEYEIEWGLTTRWLGEKQGKEKITVTSDKIAVGDFCYFWSSQEPASKYWVDFLKKTKYMKKLEGRGVEISCGGDGSVEMKVVVRSV